MLTPPLYVLKIKYSNDKVWRFVNEGIIAAPEELVKIAGLEYFMSKDLRKTQKLMFNLILQNRENVEALKIVELSHYPPYPEFSVLQYQEVKKSRC